jgi:quinoprotein glucose dehydrogenase
MVTSMRLRAGRREGAFETPAIRPPCSAGPERVKGAGGLALSRSACVLMVIALSSTADAATSQAEWPTYGHDPGGMRYSPLSAISPDNVTQLQVAWTYHMRPADAEPAQTADEPPPALGTTPRRRIRFNPSQATPLVIDGRMYVSTPYGRVVALEAATGKELWAYDVPGPGQPSLRGVEYWPGDSKTSPRVLFGTRDGRLIALDASKGTAAEEFGTNGIIDLKTPDMNVGEAARGPAYGMTSPPLIFGNLVITGSATQEFPALGAAGDIRAWDVRTGRHVWTFHTVPRPGEYGHRTWQGDSWRGRSGVNVWGFMTVDVERGILYAPVAAPAWDRYGGDRLGANLFSSSIVALDARTGRRRWHFQLVHHDIWDMDTQAPPLLLDVNRGRRKIPAVAIVSKSGMLFLLDRRNGKPLFRVIERPVPASDVAGEQAWPTQPFPEKPPPFARQSFSMQDLVTITPELESFCRTWIDTHKMRMGGPYLPIGYNVPTINFPGRQGGANWGGASFDSTLGFLFVNANNLGQVEQLTPRSDGTLATSGAATGRFADRNRRLMCQQPPWGTLTAIDVHSGEIAWQVPLGVSDNLPAAVARTGRPNVGGSIATASGLVFIAATDDARLRAFNARTGEELWSTKLPASAHATPITYEGRDGRQYLAVVATGGSFLDSPIESDALMVFALPDPRNP